MVPKTDKAAAEVLQLPNSLISRVDATRVGRELETLANAFEQQSHHHTKAEPARPSEILEAVIKLNKLDLSQSDQRDHLASFLKELKTKAPTIHMSFAADPSSAFTNKLITWLRSEIHPLLLLDIGLQPSIAAGCIIRTSSKYFDCSMRQHLVEKKPNLVSLVRGVQHA